MKRILLVLLCVCGMLLVGVPVSAETAEEIYAASGAEELELNAETQQFLDEQGVSFAEPESLLTLSPKAMLEAMLETLRAQLAAPLKLAGTLGVVILLAALTGSAGDTAVNRSLTQMFEMLCVLVCVTVLTAPVQACFTLAADTLRQGGDFMLTFVPVFATVAAASGAPVTASAYHLVVLSIAEVTVQIADLVLMPLLNMMLALSIVDAVHPALSLSGLLSGIRKCVTWCLGLMMALVTGLLSVQGIVAGSADQVGTKATKFMLSSCVPVVGSAVSDAYGTVSGSVGVIRSGIGGVGVLAMASMILPPLLLLVLYRLCFAGAGLLADVLDVAPLRRLLQNLQQTLSLALGVLACFSFMLLLATALVMLLCGRG